MENPDLFSVSFFLLYESVFFAESISKISQNKSPFVRRYALRLLELAICFKHEVDNKSISAN